MGTLAVLAIKQEPQGLLTPAQAVVQNKQEVSVPVQRSLEASVYGGIIMDKSWLQGAPPQQSPSSVIAVQQITQPPLPLSCATSGSISLINSNGASIAGIQGDSPSTMIKKR